MKTKCFSLIVSIALILAMLTGCQDKMAIPPSVEEQYEIIAIEHTCGYAVEDFSVPSFQTAKNATYITEKEAWREPLTCFLSSHIDENDGVGLFDLDFNGIPEVCLWRNGDGGTALNSTIAFFDLISGEPCGGFHTGWYGDVKVVENSDGMMVHTLDGTMYGMWEVYLDERTSAPKIFGRYSYGNFFNEQPEHHFSEMLFDEEAKIWYNEDRYYWFHHYDRVYKKSDDQKTYVTVTIDTGWHFKRDYKTTVLVDEVNAYFNDLAERYRVVKDSQMIVFEWKDIEKSSKEDRINCMVDKLLFSRQQFIKTNNYH